MKSRAFLLGAILLSVAVVVLAVWWSSPDSGSLGVDGPPEGCESGCSSADASGFERYEAPIALELRVIDAVDHPIAGAEVRLDMVQHDGTLNLSGRPLCTDANGLLALPLEAIGKSALATKEGYVANSVRIDGPGRHALRLLSGRHLTVRCQSGESPVHGCSVIFTSGEPLSGDASHGFEGAGCGDPESSRPIWHGTTDERGECAFDLPQGRTLRMSVFHDAFYPVTEFALGMQDLSTNSDVLEVEMKDMYGVVAVLPPPASIRVHAWEFDNRARSTEPGGLARMRYCAARLARRFPGARALALCPLQPSAPIQASLTAMDYDGKEWRLRWAMQPIRLIEAPVFMEEITNPGRGLVSVGLRVDGRSVSGSPMRLVKCGGDARPLVFPVLSGETLGMPVGRYALETALPCAFGDDLRETGPMALADGASIALEVSIPYQAVRCEFEPRLAGDPLERAVALSIQGDRGSVNMVWRKERGPLVSWLPVGEYRIVAHAQGYALFERSLSVRPTEEPIVLDDIVLTR